MSFSDGVGEYREELKSDFMDNDKIKSNLHRLPRFASLARSMEPPALKRKRTNSVDDSPPLEGTTLHDRMVAMRSRSESADTTSSDWKLDKKPLADYIVRHVNRRVKLNTQTMTAIAEAVESANNAMVEAYTRAKPADTAWHTEVDEKKVRRLDTVLATLRKEEEVTRPKMSNILEAPLPVSEKVDALRLYDILQNTEPYTEGYFDISNRISRILESAMHGRDVKEIAHLDDEEKRLEALSKSVKSTNIRERILTLDAPDDVKASIYSKYNFWRRCDPASSEYSTHQEWLEWTVSIPWRTRHPLPITDVEKHLLRVRAHLDDRLLHMENVKLALMSHYASRLRGSKSSIIGLKGNPGVGKTTILIAYAEATELPYEIISMGGEADATKIRGGRSMWVGAEPGIFVQAIRRMQVKNSIVIIDELDKVSEATGGTQGSVENALIHITDPTQNSKVHDEYIGLLDIDLSELDVFFTFNDDSKINPILKDRISTLQVIDYTPSQKLQILKTKVFPRMCERAAVKDIHLEDTAFERIIEKTSKAHGLRSSAHLLTKVLERAAYERDIGKIDRHGKVTKEMIDRVG